MSQLRVRGLARQFGAVQALQGVDFEVGAGEFFCILGASSAGKTTTLRAIAGLEEIAGGTVEFDGRDVTTAPVQGRGMSMIFQTFALYPHLSIRANLAYPLVRSGVARADVKRRVGEVGELLRVTHTLDRKPPTLSGGEQQRVAIGRAIVQQPRLLLLDEPLTNLDAKLRHDMRAEFKRLHRELGMTMLYATPDQLEALSMGQRIALLRDGRIVETNTPHELYGQPSHTYVARMVGSPEINLLGGTVAASGSGRSLQLPFGELAMDDPRLSSMLADGDTVTLGIRPQDVDIGPGASGSNALSLAGRVHLTEPLGDVTIIDVSVQGRVLKMVVREEVAANYRAGQDIQVSFTFADAHLFMTETGVRVA